MPTQATPKVESVELSFRSHRIHVTPQSVSFSKEGPRGGLSKGVTFDNASLDDVATLIEQAKTLQQQMKTLELMPGGAT